MKVKVDILGNDKESDISKIKLSYIFNDKKYSKEIKLNYKEIYKYSQDTESVAFDFLLFTVIIYNIDCLISRHYYSVDGWRREIEVEIPVKNINKWKGNEHSFEKMTSFLTGDFWKFDFIEANNKVDFWSPRKSLKVEDIKNIEQVCLFSGGLDSLVGALSLLEGNKKTLFCSHYSKFEKREQDLIKKILHNEYENFDTIQVFCSLSGETDINSEAPKQETTFRARSLLFLGIALYMASSVSNECKVFMPENGTISLNLPLTKSRRGSCSTRTTHPTFIKLLKLALNNLDIKNEIINPFEFKTKGELVKEFTNQNILEKLIEKSVSCGKRGHKINWDEGKRGGEVKHCGICMPCIYRRIALDMIGKDKKEKYGRDIFTSHNFDINNLKSKSSYDFRALLHFLNEDYDMKKIQRELLINGLDDLENIKKYAEVVSRTRIQINNWLMKNSNKEINYFRNKIK